jgi:multiple sugar transport system permease protein
MKSYVHKAVNSTIFSVWVLFLCLIVAFPFMWLLITSFKTYPEIYAYPIKYLPHRVTFEHFYYVFKLNFLMYFKNSAIIGFGTSLLTLLIATLPSYASVRYSFQGKKLFMLSILFCQMFPQIVFVIPFFILLKSLHMLNYLGVILSYLPFTTPIAIWMIRNFFIDIPVELEEAARIDGCTPGMVFYRIALPLALPGIASVGIYAFFFAWCELMFALSFLTSGRMQTVPVFLSLFVGQYQTRWGPLFAGSTIASILPLIVFGYMQKFFIKGLTAGAVKG